MTLFPRALAALLLLAPAGALQAQTPLTLQQAVALAQAQGDEARAALASRDAARYSEQAFSARFLPRLALGGTLPRYNRAIIPVTQPDGSTLFRAQNQTDASLTATITQQLPTGGDLFVSSSLATLRVTGERDVRTWSSTPVSIGLRQELFRPNVFALDRREQPVRTELAEREYLEAREEVAIRTTNLFFDVYAARLALENAGKNAAVNDTLYTLNKGRYEVGRIGENDLLQSELALLRARAAVDGARLELERAEAAFRLALELPAGTPVTIQVPGAVPAYPADTARAAAEALRNRAPATQVELRQLQADRAVTEARLQNGFSATVQASYGFNATASELDLAYRDLLEAQTVSVGVSIPLLQWGLRANRVAAAKAERERVASTGKATLEQATLDARFAALELEQSRRNLAISAKADTVAAKRFEVAYNRYVVGRIDMDNLYVAQAEKDRSLQEYLQALRRHWVAHYQLRRLTLFDFAEGQPIR